MQRRGYTYDFVSDRQLQQVRAEGSALVTGGGARYATVVVPASRYIPLETFLHLVTLANQGASVLLLGDVAADVPGLADLSNRRDRLRRAIADIRFGPAGADGITEAPVGRGRILRGATLDALLPRAGIARESLVDHGLEFARRRSEQGRFYFVSNTSAVDFDGWVPLGLTARHLVVHDPMRGTVRAAPTRPSAAGGLEVRLDVPAGESLLISGSAIAAREPASVATVSGAAIPIEGPWTLSFVAGGPTRPAPQTLARLASWTTLGGDAVREFSGTATYVVRFPRPRDRADLWRLDLGRVHDSARVRLNGQDLETLIGPHFRLTVTPDRLRASNLLEVTVTNLMANRVAALERSGVPWKTFYNVNFPARLPENRGPDGLFSAAKWEPLDSGLLGPVVITPLRITRP